MNDKDDMFMSDDDGESWIGGPCPRVENLTMHDEFTHYEELLAIGIPESNITNFIYRFLHIFGEPK